MLKQYYFAVNIFGQQDQRSPWRALPEVSKELCALPTWIFRNSENPGKIPEVWMNIYVTTML